MGALIGIGVVGVIVGLWYLADYVFDEAFEAIWSGFGRLFRREPKGDPHTEGETGRTGFLMPRADDDEGNLDV